MTGNAAGDINGRIKPLGRNWVIKMTGAVIVWLVTAVVLGVIESATVTLVSIWMALAAVASAITAAFGGNIMLQILVFVSVSAILLALTAPLTKKFRNQKKTNTNADRLLGQEGVVIQKIDPIENKGQIKVLGQIWSASSETGETMEPGEKVTVQSIEGVRAVVKKLD